MHQSSLIYLLTAGLAQAWKLQPGNQNQGAMSGAGLFARQDGSMCSILDTCSECFGDGYIICDKIGCFNPDIHQQCCSGASLCVGRTNNCCKDWDGPGETGTSGVPSPAPTPTAEPTDVSWYSCYRDDTGEECCQRAPHPPLHWCSGSFPAFRCYNDANQWCCTDGTVCDEEDCCELFNASTTHPWGGPATTDSTTTGPATVTVTAPPEAATTGTTAAAADSTTSTSTGGATGMPRAELAAIGVAALGLGLF